MRFTALILIAALTTVARPVSSQVAQPHSGQPHSGQPKALFESDNELRSNAKRLADIASKIRINGRDQDWNKVPAFEDNAQEDCSDKTRDIVQTSVAVLNDRILVMLKTRGRPSREPNAFWVNIDIMGSHVTDLQIGFSPRQQKTCWISEKGITTKKTTIGGIKYKIGSHFTAEIPIASVRKAYEKEGVEFPADALARGWVRVKPFSYNIDQEADMGAAAACPVLDRNEFFDNRLNPWPIHPIGIEAFHFHFQPKSGLSARVRSEFGLINRYSLTIFTSSTKR